MLRLYLSLAMQYPKICREEVSIHVIQSREHILNTVRETMHEISDANLTLSAVFGGHLKVC